MLGFLGIVALPVEIGVFPALLLYASRRKGEYIPGFVLRFLAHPVIIGAMYLISVGILFLHGLFIWQELLPRTIAILVGVAVLVVTVLMMRQGAFSRRLVIEVRQEPAEGGVGTFMVTDSGRAATQTKVELGYLDGERICQAASGTIPECSNLRFAKFSIPGTKAQELKVWLHRVTAEGQTENVPALVKVFFGQEIQEFPVDGAGNQFVLPLRDTVKKANKGGVGETGRLEVEVQLAAHTT
jgi:hypothetical protein